MFFFFLSKLTLNPDIPISPGGPGGPTGPTGPIRKKRLDLFQKTCQKRHYAIRVRIALTRQLKYRTEKKISLPGFPRLPRLPISPKRIKINHLLEHSW